MNSNKIYLAIDLKSFYASTECIALGLDPLNTNLVVADESRTNKTICLAVSPALKSFGVPSRPRLFEVEQKIKSLNLAKQKQLHTRLPRSSIYKNELFKNKFLKVDYLVVPPRMHFYLEMSTKIYQIYLRFVSQDDIHVYSIDEVFIDLTSYLKTYGVNAHTLTKKILTTIMQETGITATAGIGENLYLAKVAMDIVAKKIKADKDGVRIAHLTVASYRKYLWAHEPITDFWRVGRGYAKRLAKLGLNTMGDIAACSLGTLSDKYNEELLYKNFGVNAELLIDHAWGKETTTLTDIKNYRPKHNSLGSGQVLMRPYTFMEARLIVREMSEALVLELLRKKLVTNQIMLTISYDIKSLTFCSYTGPTTIDFYGREVPKHGHGTTNFKKMTASDDLITPSVLKLYAQITNPRLLIRKITITASNIMSKKAAATLQYSEQLDLFSKPNDSQRLNQDVDREERKQQVILALKERYGQRAIFKASDLKKEATALQRGNQIGGHKA